jgi:hypothetical protein
MTRTSRTGVFQIVIVRQAGLTICGRLAPALEELAVEVVDLTANEVSHSMLAYKVSNCQRGR